MSLRHDRKLYRLCQLELQLGFTGNLHLVTFLYAGGYSARNRTNRRTHSCIAGDGADGCAQPGSSQKPFRRTFTGALALGIKNIGHDRNGVSVDYDLCQLKFELRRALSASG